MTAEIVLVRHAETEANAAGMWQGSRDAPLTPHGENQVGMLRTRLAGERFDLIVSSDLGRARTSAAAAGGAPELDPAWREMELGAWEGKTNAAIGVLFAEELAALRRGEDLPIGGNGERFSEFTDRIRSAFDSVAARLDDGERALIVTHGGVVHALASHVLGVDLRGKALRATNTSLSSFLITDHGNQVVVYNDAAHLPGLPLRVDADATHLVLVRHGQTKANIEQRWQGHSDGELTDEGHRQARLFAANIDGVDAVYTSPLLRAQETAAALGDVAGIAPIVDPDLKEIGFGAWESLTPDEISARDPGSLRRLRDGEDIIRGGTGETFGGVRDRMTASLEAIAGQHNRGTIAVVSHGGALRAFVTGVLGMEFADRYRLGLLANTGVARVVRSGDGFALGAWNLTSHLRS